MRSREGTDESRRAATTAFAVRAALAGGAVAGVMVGALGASLSAIPLGCGPVRPITPERALAEFAGCGGAALATTVTYTVIALAGPLLHERARADVEAAIVRRTRLAALVAFPPWLTAIFAAQWVTTILLRRDGPRLDAGGLEALALLLVAGTLFASPVTLLLGWLYGLAYRSGARRFVEPLLAGDVAAIHAARRAGAILVLGSLGVVVVLTLLLRLDVRWTLPVATGLALATALDRGAILRSSSTRAP